MTFPLRFCLASLVASLFLLREAARAQSLSLDPVVTYPSGGAMPMGLALGDVTGDGQLDAVVTNISGLSLGVLPGLGDGTFGSVAIYPAWTGNAPQALALGDMNQDGQLDAVIASTAGVGVLLNLGAGVFGPVTSYSGVMTGNPHAMALADLNQDGRPDVVTVYNATGTATVRLNQGNGLLGPASSYVIGAGSSPTTLALGDVTGDGQPDLVAATSGGGTTFILLPGTGIGGFGPTPTQQLNSGSSDWLTLGDVNLDGRLDIVASTSAAAGSVTFLGQGNSTFAYTPAYQSAQSGTSPVLVDLNHDGLPDLLSALSGGTSLGITLGVSGGFGPALSVAPGTGNLPICLAVGDLNGDGRPDVVTANHGQNFVGTVGVLLNATPVLTFTAPGSGNVGSSLTLRGLGLAGATAVTFTDGAGGTTTAPASSFTATSYTTQPNTVTLPIPATLTAGSYAVRVNTPRGLTNTYPVQLTAALAVPSATPLVPSLLLAPNPAHEATTLLLTTPAGTPATHLRLYDAQGRLQHTYEVAAPANGLPMPITLSLAGLAPGLYLLSGELSGHVLTRRLLIN